MKRIYVAGSYNAGNVIGVLDNMRRGMEMSKRVLLAGYAPFVPWFDYHFQLMLKDDETLSIEDYHRYSMAWLEVSDAVMVVKLRAKSVGTQAEINRATELKIPVYYSFDELQRCINA
jgi:hypothetical protein